VATGTVLLKSSSSVHHCTHRNQHAQSKNIMPKYLRFVTTGTVSLKGTGGPPVPHTKTQLGLGGAKSGAIKGIALVCTCIRM